MTLAQPLTTVNEQGRLVCQYCMENPWEDELLTSALMPVLHMTRITQELTMAVWALGFVLIPWDLIRRNKNGPWPLTKPDGSFTSHSLDDIIHQAHSLASPMTAHPFNKPGHIIPSRPHHPQELFWEVSSGISAEIHRKPTKILGSRLASSPS